MLGRGQGRGVAAPELELLGRVKRHRLVGDGRWLWPPSLLFQVGSCRFEVNLNKPHGQYLGPPVTWGGPAPLSRAAALRRKSRAVCRAAPAAAPRPARCCERPPGGAAAAAGGCLGPSGSAVLCSHTVFLRRGAGRSLACRGKRAAAAAAAQSAPFLGQPVPSALRSRCAGAGSRSLAENERGGQARKTQTTEVSLQVLNFTLSR